MKCRKIKLVQKYIDGEVDFSDKEEFELHLKECSFCKEYLALLKHIFNTTKSVKKIEAPSDFDQKVINRIKQTQERKRTFIFSPSFKWAGVAVFSICLFAIVWIWKNISYKAVEFKVKLPSAKSVSLVGDFNNWNPKASPLLRDNGGWKVRLSLEKGRFQYMFVVDGEKWIPDPNAQGSIADGYGGRNSVIDTNRPFIRLASAR